MTTDNNNGQTPKKRSGFIISMLMLVVIVALSLTAIAYLKEFPPLAVCGIATIACAICCPWIRRNAGAIGMPIAGAGMLYFSLAPNPGAITESLPSADEIRANLPTIEWPQSQESESGSSPDANDSSSSASDPSSVSAQQQSDTSSTVLGYIKPSRPTASIRGAVDSAIAADKAELAVIQHTDKWGSWLSYCIWVQKKFKLEPLESEWRALRNGLQQTPLNVDSVKSSRDAMLALGNVSLNEAGQAQGANDEATLWINSIYEQYLAEVKNK